MLKRHLSNLPGGQLKKPVNRSQRRELGSRLGKGKVNWNSHPLLRLAKCIIYESALEMAGRVTDFDILFAASYAELGITGERLLERLRIRLPQAVAYYEKIRGEPLTAGIVLDRFDKMFREENRKCMSREHPLHHPALLPVLMWARQQLVLSAHAENTFHKTTTEEIPAPHVIPKPTKLKQTDIRGLRANELQLAAAAARTEPYGLSQSEIIATLKKKMSTHTVYDMSQLIRDIAALTPGHLDLYKPE